MNRVKLFSILFILLSLMFFSACIDHGIEPIATKVVGTVIFEGEWPEAVPEALGGTGTFAAVALAYDIPPGYALDINYLAAFNTIDYNPATRSYDYELFVTPGTYNWLIAAVIPTISIIDSTNIVAEFKDPISGETGSITLGKQEVFNAGTLYVDFSTISFSSDTLYE